MRYGVYIYIYISSCLEQLDYNTYISSFTISRTVGFHFPRVNNIIYISFHYPPSNEKIIKNILKLTYLDCW